MDFLGLGPLEILVVLVIILIIFGPMKLPEIAGQIGKTMREVRKATTEMTRQINQEVEAGKKGIEAIKSDIESAASPKTQASPSSPVPNRSPEMTGQINQKVEAGKKGLEAVKSDNQSAASPKAEQAPPSSPVQTRREEQR